MSAPLHPLCASHLPSAPHTPTFASHTRVPHPHIRVPHLPTSASPHSTSGPLCTLGRRFTVRSGPQRERLSRVWAGFAHLGDVLLCEVGPNAVVDVVLWSTLHPESIRVCSVASSGPPTCRPHPTPPHIRNPPPHSTSGLLRTLGWRSTVQCGPQCGSRKGCEGEVCKVGPNAVLGGGGGRESGSGCGGLRQCELCE